MKQHLFFVLIFLNCLLHCGTKKRSSKLNAKRPSTISTTLLSTHTQLAGCNNDDSDATPVKKIKRYAHSARRLPANPKKLTSSNSAPHKLQS